MLEEEMKGNKIWFRKGTFSFNRWLDSIKINLKTLKMQFLVGRDKENGFRNEQ